MPLYTLDSSGGAIGSYGASLMFGDTYGTDYLASGIASVQTTADDDQNGLSFFCHSGTGSGNVIQEVMRLDHSGNLWLGTTSPSARMHILQTAAADSIRVDDETTDTTRFINADGNLGVGVSSIPTLGVANPKVHALQASATDDGILCLESNQLGRSSHMRIWSSYDASTLADTGGSILQFGNKKTSLATNSPDNCYYIAMDNSVLFYNYFLSRNFLIF